MSFENRMRNGYILQSVNRAFKLTHVHHMEHWFTLVTRGCPTETVRFTRRITI